MPQQPSRWTEVTPSQFTHEAEGLRTVKELLPDHAPYRAWSNFEFRDGHGKWHEVDLVVLGRRRLHLVELKYYSGTLRGDDHRWLRDGHRAEDSPLKLARRKAQRLASRLQDELFRWARESSTTIPDPRDVVPFVQESVFLHHPDLRVALSAGSAIDLYGPDDRSRSTGLPGVSERLLEPPDPTDSRRQIGENRSRIISKLMTRIGAVQRRQREAGSWVIDEEPLGDGEGWQDWPAFHRVATTDRARVRFFISDPGSSHAEQARVKRVAEHEYRIMARLQHDGLLRPRDMVDSDLGIGVVYPADERYQRLDLWMSDQVGGVPVTDQLSLLRQVAEAVAYAHGNRVVHRGLSPYAVSVREASDGLRAQVGEWQSAGALTGTAPTSQVDGVTRLLDAAQAQAAAVRRLAGALQQAPRETSSLRAEVFHAPEGVYARAADRIRLDVFALGALAYYVLSGRPPAADPAALLERLRRDGGLDLAADLPQVSSAVRALVLDATKPSVTERMPDVRTFLEALAAAERATGTTLDEVLDPLEALPGALLDGRFEVQRRLGAGSTAVGLLVKDHTAPVDGPRRVLKVALNDAAAARLVDEAQVLATLDHPRLVTLLEGPLDVRGRRALLLESAGEATLGEELRARTRTSLDLLERWGTDLLEALVALDRAGVDHRDIKPANLGVRAGRGDRVKHLVLFDFSLSRAGATALNAGTPPYLDPFLADAGRGRYDTAAERYAAAVVLFEMATGDTPVYGDGASHAAAITDEATVTEAMFDPSVAPGLVPFFRRALARTAADRFDTAAEMLQAWRTQFTPLPKTAPDDAAARVEAATTMTRLDEAGLSARALSALEFLRVATVGDLLAVDPVRLSRLAGVAETTRREVRDRARSWRERLGADAPLQASHSGEGSAVDVAAAGELLLAALGSPKAKARRATAHLVLGVEPGVDAFATQGELALALGVSRARGAQQVAAMQEAWAKDPASRDLLDEVGRVVGTALSDLAGVATVEELTGAVQRHFGAATDAGATGSATADADRRAAAGLLRLATDRLQALVRADAEAFPLVARRRGGRVALIATDAALLDAAETLGRTADALVARARDVGEPVVTTSRAAAQLRDAVIPLLTDEAPLLPATSRLLRLAAGTAQHAQISGTEELHHRDLEPVTALALALSGIEGRESITAHEVIARVRARFPALPALPGRPRLDQLVDQAQLALYFDAAGGGYRSRTRTSDTTGLESRLPTTLALPAVTSISHGHVEQRLRESIAARSFLALGAQGRRLDQVLATLLVQHPVDVVDLTDVLLRAMKETAAQLGLPWQAARAADAAAPGSREAAGLSSLVARALPAVDAAVEAASDGAPEGSRAVLVVEAAPLARYDHLGRLSRWTDLAARRRQAVWLLVPQVASNQGPVVDGRPLPLAAPGQFLRLDDEWLGRHTATTSASTAAQGAPA